MKRTIVLLILFSLMILLGIVTGEPYLIFKKAISVCLSCIGIAS